MKYEICWTPTYVGPYLYGILIPADGLGGGRGRSKPSPPLLNYFLMVDFVAFYDTTLYIWIAPTKTKNMRVLGKKLWTLWQIETKF